MKRPSTTIIIPVYGDWASLEQNIKSLKKQINVFSRNRVVLVNDCGPDADQIEIGIKKLIKNNNKFTYYRNSANIGFVKTCNKAVFELSDKNSDVLLLNSDTIPTSGFLREMRRVLYGDDKVAAVCPRSNAATIFSVPMIQDREYSMEESYSIYKKLRKRLPISYVSPIAHGFCMLIRRSVIEECGLFDEIYAKGYGEENDFCMRIREHGYQCAVANRAFVFHFRARSFTPEKREELVNVNEKILTERYPNYRKLVERYIEDVQKYEK